MNLIKKYYIVLSVVLALIVSRLIFLSQFPPILNRDEAALAYNAKLILETGKDEWGKNFPLQFQSFGDFKLPGYIYTLVPIFAIFGESDLTVRLPAASAGIAIAILGASLFFEFYPISKTKQRFSIILLFFTMTPVFFFYSRMAWEANLSLFFAVTSIYLVLKKVKKRITFDIVSAVFMFLAVFTYNTPLLLLPFLLAVVIVDRGFFHIKNWIIPVALWTFVLIFGFMMFFSVATQKTGITIFSDETTKIQYPIYRQQYNGYFQSVFGNKYVYWSKILANNYVATFSPKFLVSSGGSHPWHSILGRGHIYWVQFFFLIVGFVTLAYQSIKSIYYKKMSKVKGQILSLYILLISPLPAVATVDAPHATRSLFTFFIIVLISAQGLFFCINLIKNLFLKKLYILVIFSIFIIEGSLYFYQYFRVWSQNYPQQLNVGFDQVVWQANTDFPQEKKVVIDDEGYLYIMVAWYAPIDSQTFFSTVQKHLPDKIGLLYGYRAGSYRFIKSIDDRIDGENIVIQKKNGIWKVEKN